MPIILLHKVIVFTRNTLDLLSFLVACLRRLPRTLEAFEEEVNYAIKCRGCHTTAIIEAEIDSYRDDPTDSTKENLLKCGHINLAQNNGVVCNALETQSRDEENSDNMISSRGSK